MNNTNTNINISNLSLEEKIGQMLLIGFNGLDVNDDSSVVLDIKAGRIGGVILFDVDVAGGTDSKNIKSPEQVKKLNSDLKSYSKIPLIVSIDQEGGRVNRLKDIYGFPSTVSQKFLGESDDIDLTGKFAYSTAVTLAEAGFNLNFAPVVDMNLNPDNPVIGKIERSFSANPEIVVKHSEVLIDEHRKQNILCTLKHFPGHGSSNADSHHGFVDVTELWNEIELEPYKLLISKGIVDSIMSAHIFNAKLDKNYPATLSKNILTGILRTQLNFDGVIISDDMNMKAISSKFTPEESIELAINAGIDILVFGNNSFYDQHIAEKALNIIKNLINIGKITETRINESCLRILKLKSKII